MRAHVQQRDAALGRALERAEHALEVQALGLRVEVGVALDGEVDVAEDLVVVGPRRAGEEDGLLRRARVEAREEEAAEVEGTGAGDGLEAAYL